jgi:methylglutaconyl-CoA hydratase
MADYKHLLQRRDGPVEHLTLNRPEVRNAFDDRLVVEMTAWADHLAQDSSVRVVVISGAGEMFCAGGDLAWMTKMAGFSNEENLRDAQAAARMFAAIDRLPVPVIARVQGAAFGGGAGLAAVADIVVASSTAIFGFTEVKLGLLPAIIAPYVLAKIGMSAARELFLTGRRFPAEHAARIGLVHAVVAPSELDDAVDAYVGDVLAAGPEAVAAAKALLQRIAACTKEEATQITAASIAERRASAEARERIRAFLNKNRG